MSWSSFIRVLIVVLALAPLAKAAVPTVYVGGQTNVVEGQADGSFVVSENDSTLQVSVNVKITGLKAGQSVYLIPKGSTQHQQILGADGVCAVPINPGDNGRVAVYIGDPNDNIAYGTRQITAQIQSSVYYTIGSGSAAITDTDDDTFRPTLTVTTTDAGCAELGQDPGAFTISLGGFVPKQPFPISVSLGGSATAGVDYTTSPSTNQIYAPIGSGSATVRITPIDDALTEGTETVTLTISPAVHYLIGSPGSATLNIVDDAVSYVSLSSNNSNITEGGTDTANFTISRSGAMFKPVTVPLSYGGTAISGVDYQTLPASVVIPANTSSATIQVYVIDDSIPEPDETIVVTVQPAAGIQPTGSPVTITIVDTDASLLGYWKFNEGTGTLAADSSGNGRNATVKNSPLWITGYMGSALSFYHGSATPQFVEVGDAFKSAFNVGAGEQISIAAWVYPTSLGANDYDIIAAKGRDGGSRNWLFELIGTGVGGAPGALGFYYTDANGAGHGYTTTTSPLLVNTWQHVAMSMTMGTPSSMKIYANGALIAGHWAVGTGANAPSQNTFAPTFGDEYEASPGSTINERFDGRIDELRIYHGTLKQSEVQTLAAQPPSSSG